MRTLELRLEDVTFWGSERGVILKFPEGTDQPLRLQAALEFFDRALIQGMSGNLNTRAVFETAAELTLLRFRVRIVGLDAENSRQDAPESTISTDPPQPTDPEAITTQSGAEWPKTLAWEEESAVLVTEPAVAHEIDRRWSEEPKLRERIERAMVRHILRGEP